MKFCYKKIIPKQCSKVRMAQWTAILITMTLPSMLNTKAGVCPPSIQWSTNSTTCNEYCVKFTYTEGQLKEAPKRCSCQKNEDVCQSNAVFQWFTNQTLFHSSCYYDICYLSPQDTEHLPPSTYHGTSNIGNHTTTPYPIKVRVDSLSEKTTKRQDYVHSPKPDELQKVSHNTIMYAYITGVCGLLIIMYTIALFQKIYNKTYQAV